MESYGHKWKSKWKFLHEGFYSILFNDKNLGIYYDI